MYLGGFAERGLVVVTVTLAGSIPVSCCAPLRRRVRLASIPDRAGVPRVGRYTFNVTAHRLALGELGIRQANLPSARRSASNSSGRSSTTMRGNENGVRDADHRLAAIGLGPLGSRVIVDWGSGPAGEVTPHDLTRDGRPAAVVWDHCRGTSLVPVAYSNGQPRPRLARHQTSVLVPLGNLRSGVECQPTPTPIS